MTLTFCLVLLTEFSVAKDETQIQVGVLFFFILFFVLFFTVLGGCGHSCLAHHFQKMCPFWGAYGDFKELPGITKISDGGVMYNMIYVIDTVVCYI